MAKTKKTSYKPVPFSKTRRPFKVDALVTGIDRSFTRSIYKMLSTTDSPDLGLFEFQSLGRDVVERWKDVGAHINRYQMVRRYDEFRRATKKELRESNRSKVKYFMRRLLRKLGLANYGVF